jgi:hypothetical protein
MSLGVLNRKSVMIPVDEAKFAALERRLLSSFFNLFVTACLGVLLRSYPFIDGFALDYKNVLHGHSHFAFGGWIMPVLLLLLMKSFPELRNGIAYKHWKNISLLLLFSAYGMLLTFPFQGYKPLSIFFSTLSVAAGYYLVAIMWPRLHQKTPSQQFLKAGLFYLAISAIGPFATGPLIAMGKQGTPIYFNAVYFYLHFQINGWFTFAVLALLYRWMENKGYQPKNTNAYKLFHLACVPAYLLSVLWNSPGLLFNIIGGTAALLQVAALFYLLKDLKGFKLATLMQLALAAFIIKICLQLLSALPFIALLAYEHRNFVIAYLHLALLGSISFFLFHFCFEAFALRTRSIKVGLSLFLLSFIATEILLVLFSLGSVIGFGIPNYNLLLLLCSILFPGGLLLITLSIRKKLRSQFQLN